MLDISQPPPKSPATKITAEQIEKRCPTAIEVEALGYRIAAHLRKMRDYEAKAHEKAGVELRKAEDNWTTVTQLLAEAKQKCSTGGFKAFKGKFCPDLSRSRIYELLQIGSGKKTLEESRAAKRERVAKSRRGQKVSATDDVADTPNEAEPANEPTEADVAFVAEVRAEMERREGIPRIIRLGGPDNRDDSSDKQIGEFLEQLGADRFFAALQHAPTVKAAIKQRHERHHEDHGVYEKMILTLVGECRAHLHTPTPANIETVFKKLAHIANTCTKPNGTKISAAEEKKPALDMGAFGRALCLKTETDETVQSTVTQATPAIDLKPPTTIDPTVDPRITAKADALIAKTPADLSIPVLLRRT
jgi:hypothetical protein